MKDIPVFTTEYGIAGLTLQEVPYTNTAFVTVHSASDVGALLKECKDFCVAVGADRVYACNAALPDDALYTQVWEMVLEEFDSFSCSVDLRPVQEASLEDFIRLYNRKMSDVPTAAYMTRLRAEEMLKKGSGYFAYREDLLLGIAVAGEGKIQAVASVVHGGGREIVRALCIQLGAPVFLEVASANEKAVALYKSLGFRKTKTLNTWYEIL